MSRARKNRRLATSSLISSIPVLRFLCSFCFLCLLCFFHFAGSAPTFAASEQDPDKKASPNHLTSSSKNQIGDQKNKLADGLYSVERSARDLESLKPIHESETLIENDFHFLEPLEREPVIYLVLQTKTFIPLTLGADPREDTEKESGKPRLQIQLTNNQVKPLQDFTSAHLGKTVAIVIGGEVVTTHKVRSVIEGGKLQITRCTKHGCETLFTSLLKDRAKN